MKGFKEFFEENSKEDYSSSIKDEFGISDTNFEKAIKADPSVISHFKIDGIWHKQDSFEIISIKKDENGNPISAAIKFKSGQRYLDDNKLDKGEPDTGIKYVPWQDVLLTQGWQPAVLAAQQSQMPGMM